MQAGAKLGLGVRVRVSRRSRRRQRRGEPHTEHDLGVLHSHSGIDEKRPTETFVISSCSDLPLKGALQLLINRYG